MKKVSEEFVIGKNNIGYVDSSFTKEFGNDEIGQGSLLAFQKLKRTMSDSEIISELKIQECTLSDVLATLKSAPEELKDGYSNIFYIKDHPSHVVYVYWYGSYWSVRVWSRDGWGVGVRVFSPATSGAEKFSSGPSGFLVPSKITSEQAEKVALTFCEKYAGGKARAVIELRDKILELAGN